MAGGRLEIVHWAKEIQRPAGQFDGKSGGHVQDWQIWASFGAPWPEIRWSPVLYAVPREFHPLELSNYLQPWAPIAADQTVREANSSLEQPQSYGG